MRRRVTTSEDGSNTLTLEDYNESYHSVHGALSESLHIFIREGLKYFISKFSLEEDENGEKIVNVTVKASNLNEEVVMG